MEVSCHALALHRADAIHWSAAVFTNLTQDHLDFHADMEDYFLAKRRLFEAGPELAVIDVDDAYGARLAGELPEARSGSASTRPDAHVRATASGRRRRRLALRGRRARAADRAARAASTCATRWRAVVVVRELGVDDATIAAALPRAGRVPGRFEPVDEGQGFAVIVDYAHTPDSLENVLRAARELARGPRDRVFGAGGDRDRAKRPLMGARGGRAAPTWRSSPPTTRAPRTPRRSSTPWREGAPDGRAVVDRRAAIERAVALAQPGDVVVIAGKGHEQGQEFEGGRKVPFDDVTVAREALRARVVA